MSTDWVENIIPNSTSIVACVSVALGTCLSSRRLETDLIYLLISRLLHSNSSTHYNTFFILFRHHNKKYGYTVHFLFFATYFGSLSHLQVFDIQDTTLLRNTGNISREKNAITTHKPTHSTLVQDREEPQRNMPLEELHTTNTPR
jgi:hypothetical protein